MTCVDIWDRYQPWNILFLCPEHYFYIHISPFHPYPSFFLKMVSDNWINQNLDLMFHSRRGQTISPLASPFLIYYPLPTDYRDGVRYLKIWLYWITSSASIDLHLTVLRRIATASSNTIINHLKLLWHFAQNRPEFPRHGFASLHEAARRSST